MLTRQPSGPSDVRGVLRTFAVLFGFSVFLLQQSACANAPLREQVLYDHEGVRVGLQEDPSLSSAKEAYEPNAHPAQLTPEQLTALLRPLEIQDFWGKVIGKFAKRKPIPVFNEEELSLVAAPLSAALRKAGPTEQVTFSIRKPDQAALAIASDGMSARDWPRTTGVLFLRGPYLHLAVTEHVSFASTELRMAKPVQTVSLRPEEALDWGKIGNLHFSLNVKETLAAQAAAAATAAPGAPAQTGGGQPPIGSVGGQPQVQADKDAIEDLRRQVQALAAQAAAGRSRAQADEEATEGADRQANQPPLATGRGKPPIGSVGGQPQAQADEDATEGADRQASQPRRTQPHAQSDQDAIEDLRLQVREMALSNSELRSRLQAQAKEMKSLKDELTKARRELADSKAKARQPRTPMSPP